MRGVESRAIALLDQGQELMAAGRRAEAEKCFRKAAMTFMMPAALNNWAVCRHLAGDYAGALEILQPLLSSTDPLPFTHALASITFTALGEREKALLQVRQAVDDFNRALTPHVNTEPNLIAYGVSIKQAAFEAGEYELVLDLQMRWPGQEIPKAAFLAGMAAFNLKQFSAAARLWRSIADPHWQPTMEAYGLVADLAQQGLVPPFTLDHDTDDYARVAYNTPAGIRKLARKANGWVRLLALGFLTPKSSRESIEGLIRHTGDWGIDLGRRLLTGSDAPMSVKLGAAQALTDAGLFAPGQPVPITHEGRATTVLAVKPALRNAELNELVEEASRLKVSGRREEALALLSKLEAEGTFYPPAMVILAMLLLDAGDLEAARAKLELADGLMPENPVVLFHLAMVWKQFGNHQRARAYAGRIKQQSLPPNFQQAIADFLRQLPEPKRRAAVPLDFSGAGDSLRAKAEEKPIQPDERLRSALRTIPVEWLNAASALYQVQPARRRPERERLLAAAILDAARREALLTREGARVRDALAFVLEQGGWVKLAALTERFGPMDGDSFWWDGLPPKSTLGRLRLLGLLYIGRTGIDGRMDKVAVVPKELREGNGR